MRKFTEWENYILNRALDIYLEGAIDEIDQIEKDNKRPIFTKDFIKREITKVKDKVTEHSRKKRKRKLTKEELDSFCKNKA